MTDDLNAPKQKSGATLRVGALGLFLLLPPAVAVVRGLAGGETVFFWGMTAGVGWTVVVMLAIFFIYRYREHEIEAGARDV